MTFIPSVVTAQVASEHAPRRIRAAAERRQQSGYSASRVRTCPATLQFLLHLDLDQCYSASASRYSTTQPGDHGLSQRKLHRMSLDDLKDALGMLQRKPHRMWCTDALQRKSRQNMPRDIEALGDGNLVTMLQRKSRQNMPRDSMNPQRERTRHSSYSASRVRTCPATTVDLRLQRKSHQNMPGNMRMCIVFRVTAQTASEHARQQ